MSVVKINALTVPAEMRATLEQRFAGRAGMVEQADGFEWFELLRPIEGTDSYLVYTRWRSEEDFQKWQASQAFGEGHRGAASGPAPQGGQHGGPSGGPGGHGGPAPAATGATLWSFEVVQSASPGTN
ncbi:antibiotic biosynthesis monooxygenase [Frankia sp. AgB32]|uniref:antibiotic biosynthesis monooxygenase family protein n=1 Tax=Frankia sp. AgB32 TaxID=631119 RepID=UPI00200D088A|nr:antibiotic biosynthesis monooxygenase [Frankia sp. AgB32]MCK9893761.1 antibiotic biosynthesis monooxygenase [Frankia sp. AgB32]